MGYYEITNLITYNSVKLLGIVAGKIILSDENEYDIIRR